MRNHFLCSQCQTYGIGRQCHTSGQKYGIVSQCHTSGIVHPVQTHFNTNQINPLSISQLIEILSLINLLPHKKTNHVKQINSGNMVIVQRQWQQCWTNRPDPADLFRSYCMVPDPASLTQHSLWLYYYKYISSSSSSCSNRIMILYIFPCFPFAHHLAFSGSHNSSSLYTLWVWECGTPTHTHTHTHILAHTHRHTWQLILSYVSCFNQVCTNKAKGGGALSEAPLR